tara:strand:+ start:322 stop:501 length:180 start_codon:yes stop_codon:yes gene_type:complete
MVDTTLLLGRVNMFLFMIEEIELIMVALDSLKEMHDRRKCSVVSAQPQTVQNSVIFRKL